MTEQPKMQRLQALQLLDECTGDEIWSLEHCRLRRLPEAWIEELACCFESNFAVDSETIFVERRRTNQYYGLRDIDIARKLGEFLGVDTTELENQAFTRARFVSLIKDAIEEI